MSERTVTYEIKGQITVTLPEGQELTSESVTKFLEEAGAKVESLWVIERSKYGAIYR